MRPERRPRGGVSIRIRLLGDFDVQLAGRALDAGQPKQRALLAVLALRRASTVSMEHFVDVLWPDSPPARARNQVQVYVADLRRRIAGAGGSRDILRTSGGGYQLDVPIPSVDVAEFWNLTRRATRAAARGDLHAAEAASGAALRLWRGPALGGLAGPFFESVAAQLEESRIAVLEQSVRLQCALGRGTEMIGDLRVAVATYPLHEGLRHTLMLALCRAGRRAEALAVYRAGRDKIVSELGIEPGDQLRSLERMILSGEPIPVA